MTQYGLIAEEVAEVDPGLVVQHKMVKLLTVHYEQINAMLLNEFLKEHKKVAGTLRSDGRAAAERDGSSDGPAERAGCANPEGECANSVEQTCTTNSGERRLRRRHRGADRQTIAIA